MNPEQFNRQPDLYSSADKQEARKKREGDDNFGRSPDLYGSAEKINTQEFEEVGVDDKEVGADQGGFWEARNERVKSPEFQETMDREKREFKEQLGQAKDASINFLYNGVIKKVLWGTVKEEAKSAFSGKYNMADSFMHTTGRIADASLSGLKAIGKIAKVTGKGAKLGARYMVGK